MSRETRATLKAFFETGDKPTQAQFVDLIDSSLNFESDPTLQANKGFLFNRFLVKSGVAVC